MYKELRDNRGERKGRKASVNSTLVSEQRILDTADMRKKENAVHSSFLTLVLMRMCSLHKDYIRGSPVWTRSILADICIKSNNNKCQCKITCNVTWMAYQRKIDNLHDAVTWLQLNVTESVVVFSFVDVLVHLVLALLFLFLFYFAYVGLLEMWLSTYDIRETIPRLERGS